MITMEKMKIVAAILDTEKLVLYRDNGNTVEIRQGDPRVQRIIDEVTTPLSTQGWAEVSLELNNPEANVYREFENLVKGAIRFFRVHKDKLSTLFDQLTEEKVDNGIYGTDKHLAPVSLGVVPTDSIPGSMTADEVARQEGLVSDITPIAEAITEADEIRDATLNQKPTIQEATAQIMSQAQPVSDKNFTTLDTVEGRDTMIATVEDEVTGEITIVPGMEHLQAQFRNAVKLGTPKGAENFLKRLAAVIGQRKHTIDELLQFMSRGDLPIADDGSIVAYKVLTTGYGEKEGYYVDCHSKQVQQRVGSYVTQANVDENRRTECSTGLHIARRGYLRGFSGNIIVLVKVAPEDVIAVPLNEPDKMRARGYHILSEIPSNEHANLRNNNPLESSEAKKLLNMALRGQHIDVIEEVAIGGPRGTEVKAIAKPIEEIKVSKAPKPKKKTAESEAINIDEKQEQAPAVDVKATSDKVVENKQTEQRKLFNEGRFKELYALKRAKKKSWTQLGFSDTEAQEILANDPLKTKAEPAAGTKEKEASPPAPTPAPAPVAASVPANENRGDKARRLFKAKDWTGLYAHKKAAKVGWEKLGFSSQEIERIVKNDPAKPIKPSKK